MKLINNVITKPALFICLALLTACNYAPVSPGWELRDPDLKEIAMIRADPHWGAVVIYNPNICDEMGDACGFFRLQAYAHKHLNHSLLAEPELYPNSLIAKADCWAAQYGKSNEIRAAIDILGDEDRNPDWKIHGNAKQRAENITACAEIAGK